MGFEGIYSLGHEGATGLIIVWLFLKVRSLLKTVGNMKLNMGCMVDKEHCELVHEVLDKSMDELKSDNKTAHTALFKGVDDIKTILMSMAINKTKPS